MSSLSRTFCCLGAGFVSCWIGFVLAATFVPLIVPASLRSRDPSESTGVIVILSTVFVCAIAGFAMCWKLTARWVKE